MSSNTVRGVAFASLSAIFALANVAVAVPARAAEIDAPTAIVSFADLDLTSDDGVARLNRRLHAATTEVCGTADIRDLARAAQIRACRTAAMTRVAPQVATVIEQSRDGTRLASAARVRVAAR